MAAFTFCIEGALSAFHGLQTSMSPTILFVFMQVLRAMGVPGDDRTIESLLQVADYNVERAINQYAIFIYFYVGSCTFTSPDEQ